MRCNLVLELTKEPGLYCLDFKVPELLVIKVLFFINGLCLAFHNSNAMLANKNHVRS